MSVIISDMLMSYLATAQRQLFSRDALSKPRWPALHSTAWPREPAFGARSSQSFRPYRCYAGAVLTDNALPVEAAEGFAFVDREMVRGKEVHKVRAESEGWWWRWALLLQDLLQYAGRNSFLPRWLLNAHPVMCVPPQPGWVATRPGQWMRLRLNTYFGSSSSGDRRGQQPVDTTGLEPSELTLIFLRSYEHMVRTAYLPCL